ncbi:class I SAM-dependent methyltransferase [Nocardia amamiensis]|uniref:class I SAM-dependent methyltransferase n=1 Tax=Nocardia amamiensis TaxID=404578 RepID=UPI0008370297|nr:class I SAM-dependent methyltransferase [Nocardia amamiensis]
MNTITDTAEFEREFGTRPGTPMIGPYSVNQMDDFYAALARGEVKPTGVMNYLQRLFIAERTRPGDRVVDVCCGRGLQLPPLYRYCSALGSYVGLDISAANLEQAHQRVDELNNLYPESRFPIEFYRTDVAEPWPELEPADVAVYTSALEHLPRELGVASLERTAAALADGGVLYLSTPNTPGDPPRRLQHRVHVYEWSHEELAAVLEQVGLVVRNIVGILPPATTEAAEEAVKQRWGSGALEFYRHMADNTPAALLGPVTATALDTAASEVLYVCARSEQ